MIWWAGRAVKILKCADRGDTVAFTVTPWWNDPVTQAARTSPTGVSKDRAAPTAAGRSLTVWPAVPHRGTGRRHGTSQSEPFDRWFRYPAGFASDYASYLLSRLGLTPGQTVVDCFAGSGVTGTAARTAGLAFSGIEAHPMIAELAALKLGSGTSAAELRSTARKAITAVTSGRASKTDGRPAIAETDGEPLLLARSFSPETLADLLALREIVRQEPDGKVQLHLKWALLACLRDVAQVKVGWPYQRPGVAKKPRHPDVLRRFEQRVCLMADDIDGLTNDGIEHRVVAGDSRTSAAWAAALGGQLADGCVSSPPYLNNFDYADATRLEAYFWGEATTWAQLCSRIRAGMLTATTQQSSTRERQESLAVLDSTSIGDQVRHLTGDLSAERRHRARGKEYDQVLPAYFHAISDVLENLSARLAPQAPVAWLVGDSAPYGVHIDTPGLIGVLSTDHGFSVEADVALRERGRRWATPKNRHAVPLTERLLILRRS